MRAILHAKLYESQCTLAEWTRRMAIATVLLALATFALVIVAIVK